MSITSFAAVARRSACGITERESVLALLEGIDWYAHVDYNKEQIATLSRLTYAYLDNPSFAAYQNVHRSALAFMRGQDAGPSTPGKLVVENWEIWWKGFVRSAFSQSTRGLTVFQLLCPLMVPKPRMLWVRAVYVLVRYR